MNKVSLLFLLIFGCSFAQNKLAVEYQFTVYQGTTFTEYLVYNGTDTYYFGYGGLYDNFDTTDYQSIVKSMVEDKVSYTRLYFSEEEGNVYEVKPAAYPKIMIAKETIPQLTWKILDEYKEILGYHCQKAQVNFRGRTFYAYFTKDIAVSEGPWKLKGLPGLILEVVSGNSGHRFEAKSLIMDPNLELPTPVIDYFESNKSLAKPLKEVLEVEHKAMLNRRAKSMASYPVGTVFDNPPLRDSYLELMFEWEKSPIP